MGYTVNFFLLISIVGATIIAGAEITKEHNSNDDLSNTFVGAEGRVEIPDEEILSNSLKVNSKIIKYPSINIISTNAIIMNDLILSDINEFIDINLKYDTDAIEVAYQSILNGDILSILLKINDDNGNYVFKTYIYNTQTDMSISNNQLCAMFDLNSVLISEMILERLNINEFYNREDLEFTESITSLNENSILYLNKIGELEIILFIKGSNSILEKKVIQITPNYYN